MATPPPDPDPTDPTLEARVAHAVAPYVGLLPDEDLEALRDLTRRFLATHPIAAPLVDRLRPRPTPGASAETPRKDPAALAAAASRLVAKAGAGGASGAGGAARAALARPTRDLRPRGAGSRVESIPRPSTHGALAKDAETLGLTALRDRINETTEALAMGIGRRPGEQRTMTRSKRIRAATAACASHFNAIHSEILWVMSHTPPGGVRARLERMLAPFQALLERYPAPAGAPAMPAMPAIPETPEAPPVAEATPA